MFSGQMAIGNMFNNFNVIAALCVNLGIFNQSCGYRRQYAMCRGANNTGTLCQPRKLDRNHQQGEATTQIAARLVVLHWMNNNGSQYGDRCVLKWQTLPLFLSTTNAPQGQ